MIMSLTLQIRMLLNLIRWPALLGTSDETMIFVATMLRVPISNLKQELTKYSDIADAPQDLEGRKAVNLCVRYYHSGSLLRACLSALRTGLLVDLGDNPTEDGCWSTGEYLNKSDEYKEFDMGYDAWVKKLWKDLDPLCKVCTGCHLKTKCASSAKFAR